MILAEKLASRRCRSTQQAFQQLEKGAPGVSDSVVGGKDGMDVLEGGDLLAEGQPGGSKGGGAPFSSC